MDALVAGICLGLGGIGIFFFTIPRSVVSRPVLSYFVFGSPHFLVRLVFIYLGKAKGGGRGTAEGGRAGLRVMLIALVLAVHDGRNKWFQELQYRSHRKSGRGNIYRRRGGGGGGSCRFLPLLSYDALILQRSLVVLL